jgi:3-oxoacyl-[acyl-carrier protein] reductase
MTQRLLSDPTTKAELVRRHLLRRLNTVEDAARFIVFLDSMKHVSGQVFQLDSRVSRW